MMKGSLLALLLLVASNVAAQWVDTRIGTANSTTATAGRFGKGSEEHGHTLPAVLEPHGMTFWTPQTRDTEQKCVCPYYYKDARLQGFRASHWIVGGCTQDYGSFTLMPAASRKHLDAVGRSVLLRHDTEIATPAFYCIRLPHVLCEMTGRSRSAIFRFTFEDAKHAYLIFETNSDEQEGEIHFDPEMAQIWATNPVHRIYQGWGESAGMTSYAVVQLRPGDFGDWGQRGNRLWIRMRNTDIVVKMGTSFTSAAGAERNLLTEIPHWDFDLTRAELEQIWQRQFWKIGAPVITQTEGVDIANSTLLPTLGKDKGVAAAFAAALYHSSFLPHVLNDVDGQYPGFAGSGIKQLPHGRNYYDDFSAWDTYRALHPLLNIISPKESADMMQSLVLKYQQGGWLPIFPCWNSYTSAMIGDHCAAILAEAYKKGIRDFDSETAYKGMRKNAFAVLSPLVLAEKAEATPSLTLSLYKDGKGRRALDSYIQYGYIPLEDSVPDAFHQREQTSRTLEYAYDDYAVAEMARMLGHDEDYQILNQRSHNWANVINPATGWADGRHADGQFLTTDKSSFATTKDARPTYITEGWPCHYTWYVPHDVAGLIELMGGKERFVSRLDSVFNAGLYWHGNEPCHQVAYLFDYAGEPWRTQYWVRHILRTEYNDRPGGLSGNDDAGQMSAWYIFSCLGFYPVCPVSGEYAIGSPVFPEVELPLENGKVFRIIAHNASYRNIYIQSAKKDGIPMESPFFTHDDLLAGSTLEFVMGPQPSMWGSKTLAIAVH